MKLSDINWQTGLFLIIFNVLVLVFVPLYFFLRTPSVGLLVTTFVLFIFTGLAVTAGYHRLYSHRAYKANSFVQFFLLVFGTIASENSVLAWSHDHRIHHRYVDTERDPYNIKKGFWYAHFLWMFDKAQPMDESVVADLMKNKLVMFQDRYYVTLTLLGNFLVFLTLGIAFNDFFGAFAIGVLLRLFAIHHMTYFINSLAHYWGTKTYNEEVTAVDNGLIAFLTFGEGYHNYHHAFASDYRNGVKWYQFDPTKWLIWTFSRMGLAWDLIRVNGYTAQRRIMLEDKRRLLEKLKQRMHDNKLIWEEKMHAISERFHQRMLLLAQKRREYVKAKQEKLGKKELMRLKLELKTHKKTLRAEWNTWQQLVETVSQS